MDYYKVIVGSSVTQDRFHYRIVDIVPCRRRDGTGSSYLLVEGLCATCGACFQQTTIRKLNKPLNRRCERHKLPGRRAVPWRHQ